MPPTRRYWPSGAAASSWPGSAPTLVRAINVLRQYDEDAVAAGLGGRCGRLAPGGLLVEGTCDEIGRRGALGAARGRPAR